MSLILKKIIFAVGVGLSSAITCAHDDSFSFNQKTQFTVPEIGSGVGLLDQQNEKFIGEKVYREVHRQMPILNNPWLEDQLFSTFSQILSQTQLSKPVGLVVINDNQINAFAVPGGLFALNTGLITSARTMDEVVGVMSHEIAHVTQRHYSRSQEAFKGQGLLALAGILVGALVATQSDSNAGAAVMLGSQAALIDKQLTYSRNQEREADRIGMQYMYAAGYNPEGMADFFEVMNRATARVSYLPDFWFTHPLTTERMSEARLRARQLPKVRQKLDQTDFEILKQYTAVLSNQRTEQQLKNMAARNTLPSQIALAAYYLNSGEYNSAQNVLNAAKQHNTPHNLLTLIQTDIYLAQNKIDLALSEIQSIAKVTPENRALNFKLAEVFIRKNMQAEAQATVQRFIRKNPIDSNAWLLMQQSANADKANPLRTVNVLRYRAEVQYWSGLEDNAIKSLLHAQRLSKDNLAMSDTIKKRLTEMQKERQYKL